MPRIETFLAAMMVMVGGTAVTRTARAEPTCTSLDDFNAAMASRGSHASTVTLRFDVTNVDPNDYFATKGALAEFADSSCAGVATLTAKLYGPDDPPNRVHPPGTLKHEYNDECCGGASCPEGWADPNPSEVIFVDGTEQCEVTMWLDPAEYGYQIDCGGTVYDAVGLNMYDMQIDRASILVGTNGSLWPMPNAVSTWNEVCYELAEATDPDPEVQTIDVFAIEDVTASVLQPDAVYSPETDLSCGADDSEFFLKFDLSQVPGQILTATLHLHSWPDGSADGDGGDLYAVADDGWSEDTLTWNTRPSTTGAALDRVSGVQLDTAYVLDASAAVTEPGLVSLAVVPQAGDLNGIHFHSSESSPALGPFLRVEYVEGGDDGGTADGSTGDGGGPDGSATGSDETGGTGTGTAGGGGLVPGPAQGSDAGCGCTTGGPGEGGVGWAWWIVLAARWRRPRH